MVLGFYLRLDSMAASLWIDEFGTFWVVERDLMTTLLRSWQCQGQSPLYYVLAWIPICLRANPQEAKGWMLCRCPRLALDPHRSGERHSSPVCAGAVRCGDGHCRISMGRQVGACTGSAPLDSGQGDRGMVTLRAVPACRGPVCRVCAPARFASEVHAPTVSRGMDFCRFGLVALCMPHVLALLARSGGLCRDEPLQHSLFPVNPRSGCAPGRDGAHTCSGGGGGSRPSGVCDDDWRKCACDKEGYWDAPGHWPRQLERGCRGVSAAHRTRSCCFVPASSKRTSRPSGHPTRRRVPLCGVPDTRHSSGRSGL